jgi:nicotinate-nucleotide adenylyltransferase
MARFGIFGGTFDPIHTGHVVLAVEIFEAARLDRLFVVPAARSPHKDAGPSADGALRVAMARAAFAFHPAIDVVSWEIDRGGTSFTIDTLLHAQTLFRDAEWTLVLGEDSVPSFPRWKNAAAIAKAAEVAIARRPSSGDASLADLRTALPGVRARLFETTPIGVSSTAIRARAAAGLPIRGFVVEPVARAIERSGLYRKEAPKPSA